MAAPTVNPDDRDPATVAPTDSYQHADPVWVFRNDAWCAGVVEAASAGGGGNSGGIEGLIARPNVLFEDFAPQQTQTLRDAQRALRGAGGAQGASGNMMARPKVAIFLDVPNLIYAADQLNVKVDFGKLLDYLTEGRQLVRATAGDPDRVLPVLRVTEWVVVGSDLHAPFVVPLAELERAPVDLAEDHQRHRVDSDPSGHTEARRFGRERVVAPFVVGVLLVAELGRQLQVRIERCRALLADELGVDPSPELEALYLRLLRAGVSNASGL